MSSPTRGLSRAAFAPVGSPTSRQVQETAPASGGTKRQLDLLQRAAQMMATGALTEDQATTLSFQILDSVA